MRARRPIRQRCQLQAKCSPPIISRDPAVGEGLKNFGASKGRRLVQSVDFLPEIEKYRQIKKCLFGPERHRRAVEIGLVLQLRHPDKKYIVYLAVLESHRARDAAHLFDHRALARNWG